MTDRYPILFEYFRKCPYLSELMSIAALEDIGTNVIFPAGTSPEVIYRETIDINGNYSCEITPNPSIYEDFQINCFVRYDVNDTNPPTYNGNVLTYEQVCSVCEWVKEQDRLRNFPDIGEAVISLECQPFTPQIRYVDERSNTVGYFITVRIRYVNKRRRLETRDIDEDSY